MPDPLPQEYHVGWICIKPESEAVAARKMLDEEYEHMFHPDEGDPNLYWCGRIAKHNVVIVCAGEIGLHTANNVATNMLRTFPNIKIGLLCGIGGGNPTDKHDIRLADVVVGMPDNKHGGVIQYNLGQETASGFKRKSSHNRPPQFLLQAVGSRKTDIHMQGNKCWQHGLAKLPEDCSTLDGLTDILHQDGHEIARPAGREPKLHYGLIASGDLMVKNATKRAELVKQIDDDEVLCFEMEAAGLVNTFPCLVVRGISNYCDEHKNNDWQMYASFAAASYCKFLLQIMPAAESSEAKPAAGVAKDAKQSAGYLHEDEGPNSPGEETSIILGRLISGGSSSLKTMPSSAKARQKIRLRRTLQEDQTAKIPLTGEWLNKDSDVLWWLSHVTSRLLWIYGERGVGKSTLLAYLVSVVRERPEGLGISSSSAVVYSLCNENNHTASTSIAVMIHQFLCQFSDLQKDSHLYDKDKFSSSKRRRAWGRSVTSLWNLFCHVVQQSQCAQVFVIFDAFDNYDERSKPTLLQLFYTAGLKTSHIKILFSRPNPTPL